MNARQSNPGGGELVVRDVRLVGSATPVDIGIAAGRIVAVESGLPPASNEVEGQGRLVVPGLVDTHVHLDKSRIMGRCAVESGTLGEAMAETRRAKAGFSAEDVYERGRATLERCIAHGTMRMRTHVEVDPVVGLRGLEAVLALATDYAWALDLQVCVFAQDGLTNNPGTDEYVLAAMDQGVGVIGGAPYADTDPRAQIDWVFDVAADYDADVDLHLDLAEHTDGMQVEHVCEQTEARGLGGRVTVGHVTQLSLVPPERLREVARALAAAGVAVTVLPATDLYLMGRQATHAKPRGVLDLTELRRAGVTCSLATNNVLNPFTPYGDGSLVRIANLYANVSHLGAAGALADCLSMVSDEAALLMGLEDYGIRPGNRADLVLLDAEDASRATAELAEARWGMRSGQMSFVRPPPELLPPAGTSAGET